MENECEALPGVAYPGVRDNSSTINTKTGYDDCSCRRKRLVFGDVYIDIRVSCACSAATKMKLSTVICQLFAYSLSSVFSCCKCGSTTTRLMSATVTDLQYHDTAASATAAGQHFILSVILFLLPCARFLVSSVYNLVMAVSMCV